MHSFQGDFEVSFHMTFGIGYRRAAIEKMCTGDPL